MTRATAREGIDVPHRLRLIEGDLDNNDTEHERLWRAFNDQIATMDRKLEANHDKNTRDLAGQRKILVGVLIALVTASIMLTVNVLVLGGGAT